MRSLTLNVMRTLLAPLVVVVFFQGEAVAQSGTEATVLQMNQQAMAAYGNLQFPQALQILKQAESMCMQYNIRGNSLARTYVNMGMVEYGGNGNNAGALDYFKKALCMDRSVMLDPLNSTPDMEMLFKGAQNQAAAPGACGGGAAYPQPQPAYPQPQPATGMQLIQHTQVTQQVRLVPIPVFAMVNPNVQAGAVILFYRTIGERIFQQVPMGQHSNGYAATIGCDVLQTFDPTGIEYYIAVLDPNNQLLGTSGTEAQPHQVAIVQTLTTVPPALPGEPPPNACQAECPPWNPNCNASCKQWGDLCDSDAECCPGSACVNEMCTEATGGGGGGAAGDFKPIMRLALNVGIGVGLVKGGNEDPYNQVSDGELSIATGFAFNKLHFRANPMFYLPLDGLEIGITFRGDLPLEPNYKEEVGTLVPSVLASISYRLVGDQDFSGFQLHLLAGIGWMNIMNRVAYSDCQSQKDQDGGLVCHEDDREVSSDPKSWNGDNPEAKSFFRKAGPFGVEVGIDGYYWFVNNFGLNFGLLVDVLAPKFVLNFDIQAGIAVRF